jgi:hypothetical protein
MRNPRRDLHASEFYEKPLEIDPHGRSIRTGQMLPKQATPVAFVPS